MHTGLCIIYCRKNTYQSVLIHSFSTISRSQIYFRQLRSLANSRLHVHIRLNINACIFTILSSKYEIHITIILRHRIGRLLTESEVRCMLSSLPPQPIGRPHWSTALFIIHTQRPSSNSPSSYYVIQLTTNALIHK